MPVVNAFGQRPVVVLRQLAAMALCVLGSVLFSACSEERGPLDAGGPSVEATALLELAKGQVTLIRSGKKSRAQMGYLHLNDALETGEDGEARVRFAGGRVVELGPDGRFELKAGDVGLVLAVDKGLVLTRIADDRPAQPLPGPDVQLSILTPFGLTRVSADSQAQATVNVGAEGAAVDVTFGALELVGKDGAVTKVGAGEKGRLGLPVLLLPAVEVVVLAGGGKAEVKKRDETKWVATNAKKPTPLGQGDALRVKSGRTVVKAEGASSRYVLNQGAEVVMGQSQVGNGQEETSLQLSKGELLAELPSNQKTKLVVGSMTLVSDLSSQFTVRRTKDGYELVSTIGDLKVQRPGQAEQTVFGGQSAVIPEQGPLIAQALPKEALVLPSHQGLRVFHPNVGRFSFTWEGADDAAYLVEVASDSQFKQPVVSGIVHASYFSAAAPVRGPVYWRVSAGDQEVAKGSAAFAPEQKGGELANSRNEVPDGTEKTTIYFQDRPPAVTFTWLPNADATKYKVAVYREGQLSAPVIEKTVKTEQVALPEGALAEGRYLWSVAGLTDSGEEIPGGKMNKLEISYDNAVPNLIIKLPRNGDSVGAKTKAVGIAPVGAKVQVNGKALSLDEKSRFDSDVVPLGRGLMVFRMVHGGNEVYTVRAVRKR